MSTMILRVFLLSLLTGLAAGCGTVQKPGSDTGNFIATINIPQPTVTAQGLRKPITKVTASMSRTGYATQTAEATPENGAVTFSFTGLIEGTWSFAADAYDSDNAVAFKGSQPIGIVHGQTVTANVPLRSVGTGTLEITVDISALRAAQAPAGGVDYTYSYYVDARTDSKTGYSSPSGDGNTVKITLTQLPPTTVYIFAVIKTASGEVVWQGEISGEVYPNETTRLSMTATNNIDWTGSASISGWLGAIPYAPTNVQAQLNADKSVTFTFTPSVDPVRYYLPLARVEGSTRVAPAGPDIASSGQSIPYRTDWRGKTVYFGLMSIGNDPGYTQGYVSAMRAVTFP